jgi:UDP-glucose 4-epimerase
VRVLILGGAGFLGNNLVRRCLAESASEVTVLDSLAPLSHSTKDSLNAVWSDINFVLGDIRDEELMAEVVREKDIIFCCAAQTSHSLSMLHPIEDAEINSLGSLQVLEAIRLNNKKAMVIYSSSSTVIGKAEQSIVDEDHPERPLDIYSAHKGVAEKYFRIYHRSHDLNTVVLRFGNLYGPYGKGYSQFGFVNYFIHLAQTDQPIEIFGTGEQTRSVMYVEDAVDIMWRAAHEPRLIGETYFAGGTEHATVREIAEAVVSVFERGSVTYSTWPDDRRRIEIGPVSLSSSRLRSIIDWEPSHDIRSGLVRTRAVMEEASRQREVR